MSGLGGLREEGMETFSKDVFEFREARILGGDEGAGVGVLNELSGTPRTPTQAPSSPPTILPSGNSNVSSVMVSTSSLQTLPLSIS